LYHGIFPALFLEKQALRAAGVRAHCDAPIQSNFQKKDQISYNSDMVAEQDPVIGRTLGGVRIERLLGKGGMARVYYGWDEPLQRPVAVKIIGERYRDDPAFVQRFLREARTIAAWRHPNILQVYFAGEDSGYYFFAMEYVRGMDLQELLRRQRRSGRLLPHNEVMRIARAIAGALDYAHGRGVVHRDVKPSNVIVSEDGRVVLADFGLALQASTGTLGEVFGSPHYISPEQARNSSLAVPQSDLYSFGVILYEMLAGRVPFDDPSPTTLALQHMTQEPPPPRRFNPSLSPAVEQVLLKALRKNPQERYSTAHELVETLERALNTGVADTQPMTMQMLPGSHRAPIGGPQRVGARYSSAPPAAAASIPPPPTSGVPPSAGYTGGYSIPARPAARSSGGRYLGCGLLLAFGLILAVSAVVVAMNLPGLPLGLGRPASTPTGFVIPTLTITPTETFAPSQTAAPTQTPDLTATQAALIPTGTATLPPTLTLTPTDTAIPPTPTDTPLPPPTDTPAPVYHLLFAKRGSQSLFLVNISEVGFPLERLRLGADPEDPRTLPGDDWDVRTLDPTECVAVWERGSRPPVPEGIECDRVGDNLRRTGDRRFWTEEFPIYFDNQLVGTCPKNQNTCEIEFIDLP